MTTVKRLPAVHSLSSILPAGAEGGKEFARVVGLLLFKDARNNNLEFSIFDDASGDYQGLDGFSRKPKSKEITGYQYKFFSSPLTSSHRQEIKKSLRNAIERSDNKKLKKWVLVTPDDFKNPALRDGGGDVTWFEKLREEFRENVEIEHIGHTKLISFFLESYHLCLYYYPELVVGGSVKNKSIQELRSQYDENMRSRYGRIEFVGMSVYKEGAARRIPLEDIYISLSVVSEKSEEEDDFTPRVNPISFLSPGSKTVILGDPGAGKSTLVSFLALIGINTSLQARCNGAGDARLTIVVTLRRYADELKLRKNLSIIEYVCESVKADFNMPDIDLNFFNFYIESGQAIIFFDGLDELPNREYKSVVRRRVESFNKNYPVNTVLLTSRLVGYEAEIRFDGGYEHFRMAKLRLGDIEKFIYDWYSMRVDDPSLTERSVNDLKKIINLPQSDSIRALARNPLLLTIVALVHRIDAVLPDERVVLYQKCTETLLNTWYKAKRQDEEVSKGRIERRNRLRVEAIAYWMHRNSSEEKGRAVVSREELLEFLTDFILKNEKPREQDEPAEDQAESFVSFIKNAAGLLVEAGDGLYSFIHLTFQEYLSATHLATYGEKDGASAIWLELQTDIQNPKWREVVRLLVASLRSTITQEFFVDKLLEYNEDAKQRDNVMLLLGLLNDSIDPAECRSIDILHRAINILAGSVEGDDARIILGMITAWGSRSQENNDAILKSLGTIYNSGGVDLKLKIMLIRLSLEMGVSQSDYNSLKELGGAAGYELFSSLIMGEQASQQIQRTADSVLGVSSVWAAYSPDSNAIATVVFCISLLLDERRVFKKILARELFLLTRGGLGPYNDNGMNLRALALGVVSADEGTKYALVNYRARQDYIEFGRRIKGLGAMLKASMNSYLKRKGTPRMPFDEAISSSLIKLGVSKKLVDFRVHDNFEAHHSVRPLQNLFFESIGRENISYWDILRTSDVFMNQVLSVLGDVSDVKMDAIWSEAIKLSLRKAVPKIISKVFDSEEILKLVGRLKTGDVLIEDTEYAASVIILDIWSFVGSELNLNNGSVVTKVIEVAAGQPLADLAIALRETALGIKGGRSKLGLIMKKNGPEVRDLFDVLG